MPGIKRAFSCELLQKLRLLPLERILERAGVVAAIDQKILAGEVARLCAAKISAVVAEFLGGAETAGGTAFLARALELLGRLALLLGVELEVRAQAIGPHRARQQVVDGHVVAHGFPRQAGDEAGEAAARAVGQAELGDRRLDGARGDVHDAPELALDHAVEHRLDELDRRQHVGIDRLQPSGAVPFAEVPRRRAARVVHQDVGRGAGFQRLLSALVRGDVAGQRRHFHAEGFTYFLGRRFERFLPARGDDQVDAFARERHRAALAEAFRGGAHERRFAANSEIHGSTPHDLGLSDTSNTPKITSAPPAACSQVKGSSRPSALVTATLTGPAAPMSAKWVAPMRFSASDCRNTGSTVLKVASTMA